MQERLRAFLDRIKGFFGKYTAKQKAIMASVVSIIVVFLIIMIAIISRDKYVTLVVCETGEQVQGVEQILDDEGITYQLGDDALSILVLEEDRARASVAVAGGDVLSDNVGLADLQSLLSGGFSQTQSDKERLYLEYRQSYIRDIIEGLDYVKAASVKITEPSASYSVLASDKETAVGVFLTLKSEVPDGAGDSLARFIATTVGNDTTDKITIIDSEGNLIFKGTDNEDVSNGVSASTQEEITANLNNQVIDNVQKIFTEFDLVNVAPHLQISFDKVSTQNITYDTGDRKQGPYTKSYEVNEEGNSGASGVVGTDSNDEDITSYTIDNGDGTQSTYELKQYEYAVNQTVTTTDHAVGTIDYDQSSLSIVLNRYTLYDYEDVEEAGLLDGTTWEEYVAANSESEEIEIGDDVREAVAFATGFNPNSISILAYNIPMFQGPVEGGTDFRTLLPIILAVAILALLIFAVYRSLRPVEVSDVEPELSVEDLLASTKEKTPVEDIDLNDKSDIRIAIEKFVDDQPEAVALLLRNWLNDDWG